VYEKILKDSWNVTPYKVVDLESFEIENYLSSKYSVAQLAGLKRSGGGSTSLFTYIDFKIYDSDAIFKKLEKLSPKKRKKKKQDIINKNSSNIARFYIFPK
ncbi:hypothetical protein V2605_05790, partial [Tenacibaculum maritimum]